MNCHEKIRHIKNTELSMIPYNGRTTNRIGTEKINIIKNVAEIKVEHIFEFLKRSLGYLSLLIYK